MGPLRCGEYSQRFQAGSLDATLAVEKPAVAVHQPGDIAPNPPKKSSGEFAPVPTAPMNDPGPSAGSPAPINWAVRGRRIGIPIESENLRDAHRASLDHIIAEWEGFFGSGPLNLGSGLLVDLAARAGMSFKAKPASFRSTLPATESR